MEQKKQDQEQQEQLDLGRQWFETLWEGEENPPKYEDFDFSPYSRWEKVMLFAKRTFWRMQQKVYQFLFK